MAETVIPTLRQVGLRGTRRRFTLPSKTHYAFIDLSCGDRGNTPAAAVFRADGLVVSRSDWAKLDYGPRPTKIASYARAELLNIGVWIMIPGKPLDVLADQVRADIMTGIARMRSLASPAAAT